MYMFIHAYVCIYVYMLASPFLVRICFCLGRGGAPQEAPRRASASHMALGGRSPFLDARTAARAAGGDRRRKTAAERRAQRRRVGAVCRVKMSTLPQHGLV